MSKTENWFHANTQSLKGKTVAVTGTTGGLGRWICLYLGGLGANLILVDRNQTRSDAFRKELAERYPEIAVKCISADMQNFETVKDAVEKLKQEPLDVFIQNAGAYSIPRCVCSTGFDNVFQINFASPYYMIRQLLPLLRERKGKVVAVGSIAHNYSKSDPDDIDFKTRKAASKVYGNSKRYLMFALYELFRNESDVTLSIGHPGISFTNITSHYPKVIFAIIKYPMKLIFMHPKKASLPVVKGVFDSCAPCEWIGPAFFDIWGMPRKTVLHTCKPEEQAAIGERAEQIYRRLSGENPQ